MNKQQLKAELSLELTHILNYWMEYAVDEVNGGFIGKVDHNNNKIQDSPKGSILNARILWTFSSAYRLTKKSEYLKMAYRAYQYIYEHFVDRVHGGIYWELDASGKPKNGRKQIYANAFAIYGLTEFYKITNDQVALDLALDVFEYIEKYSLDKIYNGYFEAFTEDWNKLEDVRLSEKDANESKTMNTHLHILEAYTNLYRVHKTERIQKALENLINLFINQFINKNYNLNLFFDDYWNLKSDIISFGHDIECSWLLYEAAHVLGDKDIIEKVKPISVNMAEVSLKGLDKDGGLYNEFEPGKNHLDTDKHWWPQAEAVVGFFNAWEISSNPGFLDKAWTSWEFTKKYIIDHKNGEWYWRVNKGGKPYETDEKAGFWKCPYHNSRLCMEIMERIN